MLRKLIALVRIVSSRIRKRRGAAIIPSKLTRLPYGACRAARSGVRIRLDKMS